MTPVHYVDNKTLTRALSEWITARNEAIKGNLPLPAIPDEVGAAALKIATRMSLKSNFCGYTFREELVADGLVAVCQYIKNFNPEKCVVGGGFAYITQICMNAFRRRIEIESRNTYVKAKVTANVKGYESQDGDEHEYTNTLQEHFTETGKDIITSYETKLEKRNEAIRLMNKEKRAQAKSAQVAA